MASNQQPGFEEAYIEPFTRRELEILSYLADRLSNQEIADRLTLALTTVKWHVQQITGKLGVKNRRQAVLRAKELGILKDGIGIRIPNHNLPAPLTPFVGRENELETVIQLIQEPACRLLNIIGPGGIGKTRLAIQAVSTLANEIPELFRDGIYFIPLAALSDSVSLISTIAGCLRFSFQAHGDEPKDQLCRYLRQKNILLILDNYEHLIDEEGARLPVDLLAAAPGLKILVTSRLRLNVQGEQLFLLEGLDTPNIETVIAWRDPVEQAGLYSSVQLFRLRARRARPGFKLTAENLVPITRLCQLTQGMPLGIELAAAWVPVLDPEEIAAEVEHSLDILEADFENLPIRQRNMRSVFAASWKLLTPEEQEAIQKLSVFRGGFTRHAAESSQKVSLKTILSLVNKCWVQLENRGRFQIHELLRQYAGEHLQLDANLRQSALDLHSVYFCRFLKEREPGWLSARQLDIVAEIETESQNVAAAWDWALDHEHVDWLEQAIGSLCRFYAWTGRLREGEKICQGVVRQLRELAKRIGIDTAGALKVLVKALAWQGSFNYYDGLAASLFQEAHIYLTRLENLGLEVRSEKAWILLLEASEIEWTDPDRSRELTKQSLALYEALGDEANRGEALSQLGYMAWIAGEYDQALDLSQQCLAICKRFGNRAGIVASLDLLEKILRSRGQLEEAEKCSRENLDLSRELGRHMGVGISLTNLTHTLIWEGKFVEAKARVQESLAILEDFGQSIPYTYSLLARILCHQGRYDEARACAQDSLDKALIIEDQLTNGLALYYLGDLALVENDSLEAQERFQESAAGMLARKQTLLYGLPLAGMVYAALALNRRDQAGQYLRQCLEWTLKPRSFMPAIQALPAIALLVAGQGEIERAIEIYSLASRYLYIANSKWFEDVAGQKIASARASLPTETANQAQARGRSLDLWETLERWST